MPDDNTDQEVSLVPMRDIRVVVEVGVTVSPEELGRGDDGHRGIISMIRGYELGGDHTETGVITFLSTLEYMALYIGTVLAQVEDIGPEAVKFFAARMDVQLERHRKQLKEMGPLNGVTLEAGGDDGSG